MKIVNLQDVLSVKPAHGNYLKKVMIDNGEIPHIFAFAQVTLAPGVKTEPHGHDGRYEIFLVEQGKAKLIYNGKDEYVAEKGACIITDPSETHEVSNPFDEDLVMTYFQVEV